MKSIIIPVCGNEKMTLDCIKSIEKNSTDFEIIVVDNGSTPAYSGPGRIIRNNDNRGFPIAVNQGIKDARGDTIVILNNDTLVTPKWLEYFDEHLKTFDIVGPMSNNVSGPQKIISPFKFNENFLDGYGNAYHKENKNLFSPFHRLVFFCVAIKKSVFDKIGLLDVQFTPGNFEDDDFCLRAIDAGFNLAIARDIFIYHIGSSTHKSLNFEYKKLMATNQAKFQAKYTDVEYGRLRSKCVENYKSSVFKKDKTLALVMIVKNEEQGLERAILSVRHLVDEIIISVDNSSTDQTASIARRYATTLKFHEWTDDFASVRNKAHEGAKSDWILFLDGHEYLKKYGNLNEYLKKDCDGLLCTVELDSGSSIRNPRIYKNGRKFVGKIHEMQNCKNIIFYPDFIVKHDRINAQSPAAIFKRKEQTDSMVPKILGGQLKENKKNIRASFHLALHAQSRGRFREALRYQKMYFKYSTVQPERWFVYFNRALCYISMKKYYKAFLSARAADRETPGRWEIQKLCGIIAFEKKKYQTALDYFVASFHENECDVTYKPWPREPASTWNFIGECFFRLGEHYKAYVAFDKGAEHTTVPEFKKLMTDRAKLMREMSKK